VLYFKTCFITTKYFAQIQSSKRDEEKIPQTERLLASRTHIRSAGAQIKITMCCACKAKKVTDTAKKEKLELTDFG
jgi:hypothetical protein